ncbi:DUF3392 domain-containing protein [Vibrio taketomensis]|uniref:DUF3392 domain-containing protein n=1 Tax=Vibrio taketomensis TaxID=2572923 RepID=UPI0013898F59|nr:DUF3392 domain-containing protein [Vibrio taketomensis]
MLDYLEPAGRLIAPYTFEISTALIACLLVVFGGEINTALRAMLRPYNFFVRTLAFVLINAFGYGLIIVKATPYLTETLSGLSYAMMFAVILASFFAIGIWAQRNKQI